MSKMGKYCKAYPLEALKQFEGWAVEICAAPTADGIEGAVVDSFCEGPIDSQCYFFLQENYSVTRGIFVDEDVVFHGSDPKWMEFCTEVLKFEGTTE